MFLSRLSGLQHAPDPVLDVAHLCSGSVEAEHEVRDVAERAVVDTEGLVVVTYGNTQALE